MLSSIAIVLCGAGVVQSGSQQGSAPDAVAAVVAAEDAAKQSPRRALLEFGFEAASAIPRDPHERDRARVQEVVASTFIAIGEPVRAAACALQITNWRKGSVFGDLAIDCARKGLVDSAKTYARYALEAVAEGRDGVQDWQRDRVRVKAAQAYAWLGDGSKASVLEQGVGEPEMGKVDAVEAAKSDGSDFDTRLEAALAAVNTMNFDLTVNAIESAVELAAKSKGDEARWARIVDLLGKTRGRIPRDLELKSYLRLADVRIAQESKDPARALIATATGLRDGARWTPDAALPLSAEIARRLHAVGDAEAARAEIEAGIAGFQAGIEAVADVFRAEAMRPAAEALVAMGAVERAREVFAALVEEGARNPNARPRAEDLALTAASLARAGIEPDEAMWARLRGIREGLVAPW
jgi:hypothetical protein